MQLADRRLRGHKSTRINVPPSDTLNRAQTITCLITSRVNRLVRAKVWGGAGSVRFLWPAQGTWTPLLVQHKEVDAHRRTKQ